VLGPRRGRGADVVPCRRSSNPRSEGGGGYKPHEVSRDACNYRQMRTWMGSKICQLDGRPDTDAAIRTYQSGAAYEIIAYRRRQSDTHALVPGTNSS